MSGTSRLKNDRSKGAYGGEAFDHLSGDWHSSSEDASAHHTQLLKERLVSRAVDGTGSRDRVLMKIALQWHV